MKNFLKNNFAIVLAFSLPVVLIAAISLSTYLPSLFLTTNYNFVYAACSDGNFSFRCDNYLQERFTVVDGKIVLNEVNPRQDSDRDGVPDVDENYTDRIFLHDTESNESREISLEDAEALNLDKLITSPDGVTVSSEYDRGADYFLFYNGGSTYGHYLVRGNAKSQLNLINDQNRFYYRNNFQFIGWVLPGRE